MNDIAQASEGASRVMALLLATVASKFQLKVIEDHPVVPVPSFTLRPKHGIKVTVRQR